MLDLKFEYQIHILLILSKCTAFRNQWKLSNKILLPWPRPTPSAPVAVPISVPILVSVPVPVPVVSVSVPVAISFLVIVRYRLHLVLGQLGCSPRKSMLSIQFLWIFFTDTLWKLFYSIAQFLKSFIELSVCNFSNESMSPSVWLYKISKYWIKLTLMILDWKKSKRENVFKRDKDVYG